MSAGVLSVHAITHHLLPAVVEEVAAVVTMLTRDHAGYAARLHARALPHGFFARLGPRFLRAYHETFLASPDAVALLATRGARPVGMLTGTLDTRAHRTWVLEHRRGRLAVAGLLALVVRPAVAWTFLVTRAPRYLRRLLGRQRTGRQRTGRPPQAGAVDERVAVLLHVAVERSERSDGAGRALVEAFVGHARGAGAERAVLVTRDGDDSAAGFYEHLGWRHTDTRTDRDGRPVREYSLTLERR